MLYYDSVAQANAQLGVGAIPAYPLDVSQPNIAVATTAAVAARNPTAATASVGEQNSPGVLFEGSVWDGSASQLTQYLIQTAASQASGGGASLRISTQRAGGGWRRVVDLASVVNGGYWTDTVWQAPTYFADRPATAGLIGWWLTNSGGSYAQVLRRDNSDNVHILSTAAGASVKALDASGAPTALDASNTMQWSQVAGTTPQMASRHGYIVTDASLTTLTLPTTAAVGERIAACGFGAGAWSIAQNAGQTLRTVGSSTTTGTGGSLSTTDRYAQVEFLCVSAGTEWVLLRSIGTLSWV